LRESGGSASAKAQKTDDGSGLRGLVYRVQETRIIVAVDGDNADEVLSCAQSLLLGCARREPARCSRFVGSGRRSGMARCECSRWPMT
jgi:hypothetical protein